MNNKIESVHNMKAPQQLRKPSNWQDFELLCKKLWGEIWKCEDTIQRNGRQGQKQNGVDVYGMPQGITSYYKGKDETRMLSSQKRKLIVRLRRRADLIQH